MAIGAVKTNIVHMSDGGGGKKEEKKDYYTPSGGYSGNGIAGVDSATNNKLKSAASAKDIVSQDTWDAINKPFQASSAYTQAWDYTQGLLGKLSTGRTSYSDQVDAMIKQIQNREDFEYDVDKDMLFQQALSSAMQSGKTAMQDTIGQASALTGGYGSTYATSAGNQAYNAYIQDAYNNLPEYYQMAMEAYQMEGEEMYKQLGMLNDADMKEYERLYNSWQANYTTAQDMYRNEYTAWADSVGHAISSAGLQIDESNALFNQAQSYASMKNSDYWANQKFIEDQRQKDADMALKADQFAADEDYRQKQLEEEKRQHDTSLAQDNEQFYAGLAQDKELATMKAQNTKTAEEAGNIDVDNIPSAISKNASSFKNNGELEQYLDSQVANGTLTEAEADYLYSVNRTEEQLPYMQRTWTLSDNGGINWFGGVDGNAKVKDQYGNEMSMDDLYDELTKTMSAKEAKAYIKKLQKDLGV